MAALIPGLENLVVSADSLAAMDAVGASVAAATEGGAASAAAGSAGSAAAAGSSTTALPETSKSSSSSTSIALAKEEADVAAAILARDLARARENADLVSKLQSGSGMLVGGKEVDASEYATDAPFDNLRQAGVGGPGIPEDVLASLRGVGFRTMSAIQQQSLPRVLGVGHAAGQNVVVQAQSGSGKTMSFTIGALCKVDRAVQSPQVLVLGPSRELAVQNYT
jgi:pyruvate/2-oxoglutarate dehydrogenase complex dihydrolipoamide acyltransferase (E2) component